MLEDKCVRARLSRREVQKFLEDTESHTRIFRNVGNKADQIAHELEDDSDKESQDNHEDRRRSRSIEL